MSDNFTDDMLLLIQYIDNGNNNQVAAASVSVCMNIYIYIKPTNHPVITERVMLIIFRL